MKTSTPPPFSEIRMVCIGVATDSTHRGYKAYTASAKKHSIDTRVVGLGQEWQGWKWRTEQYVNTLLSFKSDTIIVITDVYDVLFNGTMANMYHNYMKLVQNDTSKVVFGMEDGNGSNHYGHVSNNSVLPNINAGCCCGRTDVLYKVWSSVLRTYNIINSLDDQYTLGYLITHSQEIRSHIVFDSNSKLISNMTQPASKKIRFANCIHSPIVHFPGGLRWSGKKVQLYNYMLKKLHQKTYDGLEYRIEKTTSYILTGLYILLVIMIYNYVCRKQKKMK
jgi:hypothetical protein